MSTERQESKLIRNIGFWPLMGIAYGQIIGAGIMTQTGIAIGMTGTGVVLAYIVSAICTTFQNFPTAILGALEPVTAIVVGLTVFGESLTQREWTGLALIIIAVTLVIAGGNITQQMVRFRKLFPRLPLKKGLGLRRKH